MSEPVIRSRNVPSRRSRSGLIRFAHDNTSQNGEDGVIRRIFELFPTQPVRWCVDIGAWDGQHLSNTFSLLKGETPGNTKWRGIMVEADPVRFYDLQVLYEATRTTALNLCISVQHESETGLVNILNQHGSEIELPSDFDFLCVDIDGADYWVLKDLFDSPRYSPKLICIEFNPTMPDDLIYVPARSDTTRHGCSLAALVELAEAHNYVLVETTLFNAFFVPVSLYTAYLQSEVPDTSIEALHEVTMGTRLYQLYDGTLKISGCKRMLWHRLPIKEDKLQMLPRPSRQFPFAPPTNPQFDLSQVVDLGPYIKGLNEVEKKLCHDRLFSSLKENGFCFINGTGLDPDLCFESLNATDAFLNCADESVRRSCLAKDRARRGYSPMNTENFGSLLGSPDCPNDLVRKFRVGPAGASSSSLLQTNIWPVNWEEADVFRQTIEAYYDHSCTVANTVVRVLCDGLISHNPDLCEALKPLVSSCESPSSNSMSSILTLLGYRVGTRHKGKNKGPLVAAHTDVGVITLLLFDAGSCAGLQRLGQDGRWVDITLPESTGHGPVLVMNIADCFSELCGCQLPSTVHRVVAKPGTVARNCLALFVGLDPDTVLKVNEKNITYSDWRKERISKARNVLSSGCTENGQSPRSNHGGVEERDNIL